MNNTHRIRRDTAAKHRTAGRKAGSQKELEMSDTHKSAAPLFAFTIDSKTARVVKIESLDPSGTRRELSDEEKASVLSEIVESRLEDIVEQAFEAGIACVLGDRNEELAQESEEEAEVRRLLLRPLIEHSAAKRLLEREVLSRVVLGTLIRQSLKSGSVPSEGESAAGLQ